MIWIIVLAIVGIILYYFLRDRDHMLQHQVDMQGGMSKKYEFLIRRLTNEPSARVIKVRRDFVQIHASSQSASTDYKIQENFNQVVIKWGCSTAMFGTHRHQWVFPHNYPQEKMIEEIEEFMVWKTNQMFGL